MGSSESEVYLDHNASTPVLAEALQAMAPWLGGECANPSSQHAAGRRARTAVEAGRAQVAALLGARPEEIVLTSGGTESDNLAVLGVLDAASRRGLVVGAVEHPAISACARKAASRGASVGTIGVDAHGRYALEQADRLVGADTALVSLMLAHNETGVLQPVAEVARLAHDRGALAHTDAAQAVGKIAVDVGALGVDLLTVAGHKLGAPKGVGALYVRSGTPLSPVLVGAGHEGGRRPGTENVAAIVGLGAACEVIRSTVQQEATRQQSLRDWLHDALLARIPGLRWTASGVPALPNTLHIRVPGISGNALLARVPWLCASTGSACHDGSDQPPAVLLAMGIAPGEAVGALRLSLGRTTTADDVARAATGIATAWAHAAR